MDDTAKESINTEGDPGSDWVNPLNAYAFFTIRSTLLATSLSLNVCVSVLRENHLHILTRKN